MLHWEKEQMFDFRNVVEEIIMTNNDKAHSIKTAEELSLEQLINAFNWANAEDRDYVGCERMHFVSR